MRASAKLNVSNSTSCDRLTRPEFDPLLNQKVPQLLTGIKAIGRRFITWLEGYNEPRIWQIGDSSNPCWKVYDPTTQISKTFTSEKEIRIWLEERYSR